MYPKLLAVAVCATLLGAMLLNLRQQRLDAMHEMAVLHGKINEFRQSIWNSQAQIAPRLQPEQLREAISRLGLKLEPISNTELAESADTQPIPYRIIQVRHARN